MRKGKVSQLEAFSHFKKSSLSDIYILKCGSEKNLKQRERETRLLTAGYDNVNILMYFAVFFGLRGWFVF